MARTPIGLPDWILRLLPILLLLAPLRQATALPDLAGCVEVSVEGSDVTFEVTVTNQGDEVASHFYWDLWYQLDTWPTEQFSDSSGEVWALEPDQTVVSSVTWEDAPAGALAAWLQIDTWFSPVGLISESDESNNLCGPVDYSIDNLEMANLRVVSLEMEVQEDVVWYSVIVENNGAMAAPAFDVDLFVDPSAPPTSGTFGEDFVEVGGGLAAGTETSVAFDPKVMENGTYCSYVLIDTGGEVDEASEADNLSSETCFVVDATTSIDKPDLVITDFSYAFFEDDVLYTVWVKNVGTQPSGADFSVGVYIDDPLQPAASAAPDLSVVLGSLAPGESRQAAILWAELENGTFVSWAFVDSADQITELNEKNNLQGPLEVVVDKQGVDLVARDLAWSWNDSQAIIYAFTVANEGTIDVMSFDVDLVYDLDERPSQANLEGVEVTNWKETEPLLAGQEREMTFVWEEPKVGTFQSWIAVDLFRETGDLLMGNNVDGPVEVIVSSDIEELSDVGIEQFAVEASGVALDFYVRLVNKGARATGEFTVAIYLNKDDPPMTGERGDIELTVPGLAAFDPNGSADEAVWTPREPLRTDAEFSIWILADSRADVTESDELNNLSGPIPVDFFVESCAIDSLLKAECTCGADIARPGEFCCPGGAVSILACPVEQPDWTVAEPDAGGGGGGGGGCAVIDVGGGLSRKPKTSAVAASIGVLLVAVWVRRRRPNGALAGDHPPS